MAMHHLLFTSASTQRRAVQTGSISLNKRTPTRMIAAAHHHQEPTCKSVWMLIISEQLLWGEADPMIQAMVIVVPSMQQVAAKKMCACRGDICMVVTRVKFDSSCRTPHLL
jgi:hypothetical protein